MGRSQPPNVTIDVAGGISTGPTITQNGLVNHVALAGRGDGLSDRPDPQPIVFVSHVGEACLDGLVGAAKDAVNAAGLRWDEHRSTLHPADEPPLELCRERVVASDALILLAGWRHGTRLPIRADTRSYTEFEYDVAVENGKPVLAILWNAPADSEVRRRPGFDAQLSFRQRVLNRHTVALVKTAESARLQLDRALETYFG